MKIQLIGKLETKQCEVQVFSTDWTFSEEKVYIVKSIHKNNGRIETRYGNKIQTRSMVNCYSLTDKRDQIIRDIIIKSL